MSIHIQGTYRAGVIYPSQPLALPDDTKVELIVSTSSVGEADAVSKVDEPRPVVPQISDAELQERLKRYGVAVGTLPVDFSRDDIYSDHD